MKNITLAEFLGWEEGVEYDVDGVRYKIENERINESPYSPFNLLPIQMNAYKNFQNAKRIEPKKYYAKIKGADLVDKTTTIKAKVLVELEHVLRNILSLLNDDKFVYWKYYPITDDFLVSCKKEENNDNIITKMTMKEWKEKGINYTNADFEEVVEE